MKNKFDFFYRKKPIENIQAEPSKLTRALTSFDLTTLGVGWTLGGIIYIVIGDTIVKHSGPSIVASFIIAGLASLLSGKMKFVYDLNILIYCFKGMAYAELGARIPRSGSAYTYIYITIGEFVAFIVGWDVLMEYMIGKIFKY